MATWSLSAKTTKKLEEVKGLLVEEKDHLQEKYDNMSMGWQDGENGEAVSDWLESFEVMNEALDDFEMECELP